MTGPDEVPAEVAAATPEQAPDEALAGGGGAATPRAARERKAVLLRLDPAVHDALTRWAADDMRSVNAQVELLLRDALARAGRLPSGLAPTRRQGRPPAT